MDKVLKTVIIVVVIIVLLIVSGMIWLLKGFNTHIGGVASDIYAREAEAMREFEEMALKTNCEDLNGQDWSAMEDCPEGKQGVRAKDSCKSCQCCI